MLRLCTREDLMGAHRKTLTYNIIAWVTCEVMIGHTLMLVVTYIFPKYLPA